MDTFLPGSASLVDLVDEYLLIILRDGRQFKGYLRAYDQFANIVLSSTTQQIPNNNSIETLEIGVVLIRGENVALLGQSTAPTAPSTASLTQSQASKLINSINDDKHQITLKHAHVLKARGFCVDLDKNDAFMALGI